MRGLLRAYLVVVLGFLVLPVLVIVPISLTSGDMLVFPTPGWSLRWYGELLHGRWLEGTRNSLVVGGATAVLAACLGSLAAFGFWAGRFPGKGLLLGVLLAPMVVPTVVTALALYMAFARVGLSSTLTGLVLAHTVIAAPYALVAVLAALQGFDRTLLRAASSLGATPLRVARRVALPLLLPAILSGAVFAFAVSFDDLIVALFLAGPEQYTLPRQMYSGLREQLSPAICAAAVVLAAGSLLPLILAKGLRR